MMLEVWKIITDYCEWKDVMNFVECFKSETTKEQLYDHVIFPLYGIRVSDISTDIFLEVIQQSDPSWHRWAPLPPKDWDQTWRKCCKQSKSLMRVQGFLNLRTMFEGFKRDDCVAISKLVAACPQTILAYSSGYDDADCRCGDVPAFGLEYDLPDEYAIQGKYVYFVRNGAGWNRYWQERPDPEDRRGRRARDSSDSDSEPPNRRNLTQIFDVNQMIHVVKSTSRTTFPPEIVVPGNIGNRLSIIDKSDLIHGYTLSLLIPPGTVIPSPAVWLSNEVRRIVDTIGASDYTRARYFAVEYSRIEGTKIVDRISNYHRYVSQRVEDPVLVLMTTKSREFNSEHAIYSHHNRPRFNVQLVLENNHMDSVQNSKSVVITSFISGKLILLIGDAYKETGEELGLLLKFTPPFTAQDIHDLWTPCINGFLISSIPTRPPGFMEKRSQNRKIASQELSQEIQKSAKRLTHSLSKLEVFSSQNHKNELISFLDNLLPPLVRTDKYRNDEKSCSPPKKRGRSNIWEVAVLRCLRRFVNAHALSWLFELRENPLSLMYKELDVRVVPTVHKGCSKEWPAFVIYNTISNIPRFKRVVRRKILKFIRREEKKLLYHWSYLDGWTNWW